MKEKNIFKKMFQDPQTRQMNQPKMFRKKIPVGRIIPPFFFGRSESDHFCNYLHDSNSIFRAGGINSEWVRARTVLCGNGEQVQKRSRWHDSLRVAQGAQIRKGTAVFCGEDSLHDSWGHEGCCES